MGTTQKTPLLLTRTIGWHKPAPVHIKVVSPTICIYSLWGFNTSCSQAKRKPLAKSWTSLRRKNPPKLEPNLQSSPSPSTRRVVAPSPLCRKIIKKTYCTSRKPPQKPRYVFQKTPGEMWRSSCRCFYYCIINPWPMAHFVPLHHLRYVGEYSITVYFSLSFLTNYNILYLTNRPEFSRNLLGGISPNTTLMGREMWNLYTSQQFHSTHLYEELNFGHVFGRRYDRCHYRGASFLAFSSVKALERSWLCIVTDFYRYILGIVPHQDLYIFGWFYRDLKKPSLFSLSLRGTYNPKYITGWAKIIFCLQLFKIITSPHLPP